MRSTASLARLAGLAAAAIVAFTMPARAQGVDQIDLTQATVYSAPADIASWPVTATITQITAQPDGSPAAGFSFNFASPLPEYWKWYTGNGSDNYQYTVWAVVKVNGHWYTSGFIQMWQGRVSTGGPWLAQPGGGCGSLNNFACNWAYSSRWGPMSYTVSGYQPVAGEQVGFFVSAGNARGQSTVTSVRERSNVVVLNLPAGDNGTFTFNGGGGSGQSLVAVADINRDGNPDFIWRNTAGSFSAWLMSGVTETSSLSPPGLQADTSWRVVGMMDLNGDGYPDLVAQNGASGIVAAALTSPSGVLGVVSADLTGDARWHLVALTSVGGQPVFVWQHDSGQVGVMLLSQLTPTFAKTVFTAPAGWRIVAAGDLNSDGIPDLLAEDTSGNVAVAFLNGNGDLAGVQGLGATDPSWQIVALADMNHDGHPDVVMQHGAGGPVMVHYLVGTALVSSTSTTPALPQ